MFNLFGRKKKENKKQEESAVKGFYAVANGESIELAEVGDGVFSEKILGDGIAVRPTSNVIVSPCNGEITLVADTKHAIGIKNEDGVEILIHIGLETVSLNGEGFETLCKVGDKVNVGEQLVKVDLDFLREKNIPTVTMMVLVEQNGHQISDYNTNKVEAGKSLILSYK